MLSNKIYKHFFLELSKYFIITLFTFTAIVWTVQAVNFLDLVVEDGHALSVYLGYSLLNVPKILTKFIPLSFLFLKIHDFQFNSYLGRVNEIGFNFSDILKYYNIYFNSTIYLDNIHASLLNHNYWTYLFLPSIYV